ncbi:hypothetical protein F503_03192 [Ophiostoma piceae UAMH 11346]|uniref:Uncharacterized protein n=1 Tax=Ophiostoma piceae (strain UAMH 11346) TaxID=1262450 RepID=S3D0L3_OPHP1|nr:hypothetical protein F503_03192 [Ophiostoma piceae UAMH 11346]
MAGSDSSLWARLDQAFAFGMPDENGGRWEVVDPSRGRPRTRSGSSRAEHKDKVGINVTVIMPPDQQQQQFLQQQLEQRLQQWDLASQPILERFQREGEPSSTTEAKLILKVEPSFTTKTSYVLAASAPSPSLLPLHASPSSPTTKLHPPRSSQQNPEPTPKTTSWARHSTQQLSQQLAQTPTPTQILTPALTETVAKPTQTVRQRRSKSLIKSPILAPLELSPLRTTPAPATAPMPVTAAPMSSMSSTTVDIRPYTPLVQSTLTAPTCDTGKPPSSRQSDAAFSVAPKSSSKSSSKSRSQSSSSRSDDADAVSIMGESRRSNSPFRTLKSFSSSSRLRPSAAAPGKAVRKFMRLASMAASSAKDAVSGPILQKNEHGNLYPIRSPIFTGGAPSASASASSEASSPGFLISPSIVTTTSTSSSRRSSAFPSISTPVPQNLMLRHRSMSKIQQLTGLGMGDDDSSAVDPGVSASSLRRSMSTDMNMRSTKNNNSNTVMTPVTPDTPDLVTASLLQSLSQTSTKPPPSFQTAYQSPYQSAFAQYQPYQPSYQSYQSDRNLLPPNRMLKSKRYSDPNMAPIIEHPDDSSEMNSKRSSTSHYSDEAPAEVELESTMKADMNVEADLIEAMIEKLQQETIGESLPTDPASVPEESFDVDEESSFIPSRAPPVPISHPNRPTSRSSLRPSDAGTTVPVSAFSSFTTSSLSSLPTPSSIAKHIPSIRLFPSAIASAVSGTTSGASSSSPSPVSATSPSMPNISNPWPAYPPPRPAPPPPLQLDDISEVDDDEHAAGEGAEKRFSGSATSNYRSSVAMSAATSNRLSSSYHARSKSSGSASESIANSVSSVMSSVGSSVGNRATGGGCGYNGYNSFSSFSSNSTNGTGSNRLSFQQPSVPAPPVMTNTTTIMVPAQVLPPQVYPPPTSPLPAPPTSASKAHSPAPSLSQSAPVQDESRAQAQAQAQAPTPTKTQTQPFVQKQPSPISAFDHDDEDERSLAYRFKKGAVGAVPSRDSVRWRPSALGKSFFRREASPAPSEVSSFSSTGSRSVSAGFSSTPGSSSSQPTSHGHRTSLSATSIKAAGQRMAQATRKTVGGGSTSEQQRELEKEKWRENLRSQIRVIPEGQSAGSSDASATTPTSSMDARRASSRGRMI